MDYLREQIRPDRGGAFAWSRHWIETGFDAYRGRESPRDRRTGRFSHGDRPTLADLCLVPQVFNAGRVAAPMEDYPWIRRIDEACRAHPAFQAARPEAQPDWPKEVA